jgi:uridine kinase
MDYLKKYDFDSPEAIDWDLFEMAIHSLINKKPFNTPIYDIHSEKRLTVTNKLSPKDMIVVEGRLFFNYATIRDKLDFKLFLDTDTDIILSRRVYKNIARGKPLADTIKRYETFVKPSYEKFIEPCIFGVN